MRLGAGQRQTITVALAEMAVGDATRGTSLAASFAAPTTVSIYVTTAARIDESRARDLHRWATKSIEEWNGSLGSSQFVMADRRSEADVVLEFSDRVSRNGRLLAGHTEWVRRVSYRTGSPQVSIEATVEVSNRLPSGNEMSESQVCKTVLHELGHLLGLDHSSRDSDVMGRIGSGGAALGEEESTAAHAARAASSIALRSTPQAARSRKPKIFEFAK
jgi:hypothetical protein